MQQDEVIRQIELSAPRDEVWRALTEPELLSGWLARDARIDLRPGGELAMRTAGGEERTGWVEQTDAPRRLCFWWALAGGEPTRVELELEQTEAGTRLRVTESRPLARLELQAAELTGGGDSAGGPVALAGVSLT